MEIEYNHQKRKRTAVKDSYHLSANPVKLPVTLIVHLLHEISEQFSKVVVVWCLEKVQPPHIPQVGGQLLCKSMNYESKLKYKLFVITDVREAFKQLIHI